MEGRISLINSLPTATTTSALRLVAGPKRSGVNRQEDLYTREAAEQLSGQRKFRPEVKHGARGFFNHG